MGWDCASVAVRVSWPTQLKWQQLGHRRWGAWCLSPCARPRRRLAAWPCDQPRFNTHQKPPPGADGGRTFAACFARSSLSSCRSPLHDSPTLRSARAGRRQR